MKKRLLNASLSCLALCCVSLVIWKLLPGKTAEDAPPQVAAGPWQANDTVTLSPQQIQTLGIKVTVAQERPLRKTRTVSGRLTYDQDRHVALKAPCEGVITDIRVRPGITVQQGQTLAVLSSPEIGEVRAEIRMRESELELASTFAERESAIRSGVEKLVGLIRSGQQPETIESALESEILGAYRERLMSAYTRARLAVQMNSNIRGAAAAGAISGRTAQQRASEEQAAQAALKSEAEQSLFEVQQSSKELAVKAEAARRQLEVSVQKLRAILGPYAVPYPSTGLQAAAENSLSEVNLVAPIGGSIEDRLLSSTERVAAGETILVLADTSHLWAVANIRERDWATIQVEPGEKVTLSTPALPNEVFEGEVLNVGRSVDQDTGAAPLVARLQSPDDRLRPGMFIRMNIPAGPQRVALTVPEAAVVVHNQQPFVFVPAGDSQFKRVDVQLGDQEAGQIEIVAGLVSGTPVVSEGTFQLKSALLIVAEEE